MSRRECQAEAAYWSSGASERSRCQESACQIIPATYWASICCDPAENNCHQQQVATVPMAICQLCGKRCRKIFQAWLSAEHEETIKSQMCLCCQTVHSIRTVCVPRLESFQSAGQLNTLPAPRRAASGMQPGALQVVVAGCLLV